jgi:hypothetical protein
LLGNWLLLLTFSGMTYNLLRKGWTKTQPFRKRLGQNYNRWRKNLDQNYNRWRKNLDQNYNRWRKKFG